MRMNIWIVLQLLSVVVLIVVVARIRPVYLAPASPPLASTVVPSNSRSVELQKPSVLEPEGKSAGNVNLFAHVGDDDTRSPTVDDIKRFPLSAGVPLNYSATAITDDVQRKVDLVRLFGKEAPRIASAKKARVLITGVAGSGINHLLYLMELATGFAVESDMPLGFDDPSLAGSPSLAWNSYARGFSPQCGWTSRCDSVRRSAAPAADPIINVSHFPFTNGKVSKYSAPSMKKTSKKLPVSEALLSRYASLENLDHVIVIVRNPFDIMASRNVHFLDEAEFNSAFCIHADYWLHRSTTPRGCATTFIRWEDLKQQPEQILGHVLQASGLYSRLRLTIPRLEWAVAEWRKQIEALQVEVSVVSVRPDPEPVRPRSMSLQPAPINWFLSSELSALEDFPFTKYYVAKTQRRLEERMVLAHAKRKYFHTFSRFRYDYMVRLWETLQDIDTTSAIARGRPIRADIVSLFAPSIPEAHDNITFYLDAANRITYPRPSLPCTSTLLMPPAYDSYDASATVSVRNAEGYYVLTPLLMSQQKARPAFGQPQVRRYGSDSTSSEHDHRQLGFMFPMPHEDVQRILASKSGLHRIILATVPRSGNGWVRGLLEAATGLSTETVFLEEGALRQNRTGVYAPPCGWLKDCDHVRISSDLDPVVIKTHFPFTSRNKTDFRVTSAPDCGEMSYVIRPVRNPLDNFLAWQRYNQRRRTRAEVRKFSLRQFVQVWASHHEYWQSQRRPTTSYRYEDLVHDPWITLKRVLQASGLWEMRNITDSRIVEVATRKGMQPRRGIVTATIQSCNQTPIADIKWTLGNFRPILARYGYDELYEVWLDILEKRLTDPAEIEQELKAVFERTSVLGTWSEYWYGRQSIA